MSRPYLIIAGQSNGEILEPSPVLCAKFRVIQMALSGAFLSIGSPNYAAGSFLEITLGNCILRTTGRPCYLWWIQGEADAKGSPTGDSTCADNYGSNYSTLQTNVETAGGRTDVVWVDTLLHEDINTTPGNYVHAATVNTAKNASAVNDFVLDPSSHGELLGDGVHWTTDLREAMMTLFASTFG